MIDIDFPYVLTFICLVLFLTAATLAYLANRARQAVQDELTRANTDYAITLTNTRQQSYMDGVAQAERESRQAFEHGLRQGEERAIQALLADMQQDGQWN